METQNIKTKSDDRSWEKVIKKYNHPDLSKSIWQLCNSIIPYILMWFLMLQSLQYSYLLTLLLAIAASGFLIRIFIIFHDCGHGSFFKSGKTNKVVGIICGLLTFTPFHKWHHQHRIHHATAVNLDKRGIGDVWTLTKEEYMQCSQWNRLLYRFFRNPFVMFILGPMFVILLQNRFTTRIMNKEDRLNIYFTNIMLLLITVGIIMLIGLKALLLIQVPIILISHSIGIWLFFIQHNFDDITWDRNSVWDYKTAAIKGSSFLKLPAIFQWFTGNIGFHHVHHLSSRIPNYNLPHCHYENDIFDDIKPITFFSTFKYLKLHLWDEENQKMISFKNIQIPLRKSENIMKLLNHYLLSHRKLRQI